MENNISKNRLCSLTTPFEEQGATSWEEMHPAPQMMRTTWHSLCGKWQLFVKTKDGITSLGDITVPFSPETRISGMCRQLGKFEQYVYKKTFSLPDNFTENNTLLHFGAVDCIAQVFVNGQFAGEHSGGYTPFAFDITSLLLNGDNTLEVVVTDRLDKNYPYGKQRKKRGGMWYTPQSGIWQPVWLENVPQNYIKSIKITPALNTVTIKTVGGEQQKTVTLDNGKSYAFCGDSITIEIDNPVCWTPENPQLYNFTITSGADSVKSYFALRTVTIEHFGGKPYICLNGKPYFFNGLLDQGYYSDGLYTPASPEGYIYDIELAKKSGFNMLRKHIKHEPDIFYYYCDKYGIIVFQDMINNGGYSFLLDTALPTINIKRGLCRPASKRRQALFEQTSSELIQSLYNHPSVCYYTIFNEGWGQHKAKKYYKQFKESDPTRVWDTASGWFKTKHTDVISEHVYFKKVKLKPDYTRPVVLSEFGGYSCKIDGHVFNLDKAYGYKTLGSKEELSAALLSLYRKQIIPAINKSGLCATVLTQVSDVEDEINGIVTYDRRVVKIDTDAFYALWQEISKEFNKSI